ncbi:MAG: CBS domain-containing protein [Elusimicrobia bacterium]|nr:CBS domain-containing protein [Elusimicrobiota bacterium]
MSKSDLPAREFMRRDVITVRETDTAWDVARVLSEHGITGAPVVNEAGEVVGVVSQTDIVRHLEAVAATFGNGQFYDDAEGETSRPNPSVQAVDLMSPDVIEAPEDTPASVLCRVMLTRRIHRIIITRGRRIQGIVTTLDLLKVL